MNRTDGTKSKHSTLTIVASSVVVAERALQSFAGGVASAATQTLFSGCGGAASQWRC
jgi:hypothetical protein